MFGFRRTLERGGETWRSSRRASGSSSPATVANPLTPGRYVLTCWISRDAERGEVAFQAIGLADFMVFGARQPLGLVEVDARRLATTIEAGAIDERRGDDTGARAASRFAGPARSAAVAAGSSTC